MMNETYTINDAKEKICFVSQNFNLDLETARCGTSLNCVPPAALSPSAGALEPASLTVWLVVQPQ